MILPEGAKEYEEVENPKNYNEKLVQAFAKAYKWQKMLKEKEVGSFTDKAYVSKIFKLNYVAPSIVKDVLAGKQPENLKISDFTAKAIPDLWEEQREVFGF